MPGRQSIKRTFSVGDLHRDNVDNILTVDPNAGSSPVNATAGGSTSNSYTVVNSKRRRKQKQLSTRAFSQGPSECVDRAQMYDDAINSVVNESQSEVDSDISKGILHHTVPTDPRSLLCNVPDHCKDIQHLKETVANLQNQLNFVLSFLGITDVNDISPDGRRVITNLRTNNNVVNTTQADQSDYVRHSTSEAADTDADVISVDPNRDRIPPSGSYVNAVRKPAVLSAPLRNAVVSAVYHEFEEKDRRARNIVIAGVPSSSSDKLYIENLCRNELHLIVEVVKCRRLGQPKQDRRQLVLATLRSPGEAEAVIKVAKDLRNSEDTTVRNFIYINPDMTKAESLAAYQRRCRRRETAARRVASHTRSAGGSATVSSPATVATEHGTSSVVLKQSAVPHSSSIIDNCVQHSISVLNTRYLPTLRTSSAVQYQPPQPSLKTEQDVAAAVSVTAAPPATVTTPVAAGTTDPQPDNVDSTDLTQRSISVQHQQRLQQQQQQNDTDTGSGFCNDRE